MLMTGDRVPGGLVSCSRLPLKRQDARRPRRNQAEARLYQGWRLLQVAEGALPLSDDLTAQAYRRSAL
jgi:hypothetical protein